MFPVPARMKTYRPSCRRVNVDFWLSRFGGLNCSVKPGSYCCPSRTRNCPLATQAEVHASTFLRVHVQPLRIAPKMKPSFHGHTLPDVKLVVIDPRHQVAARAESQLLDR